MRTDWKPLENYNPQLEKDIQRLANQRQQMIVRYIGKVIDEWTPAPPSAAVSLFIENSEGEKTLLNTIKKPSPEFITKCEDYADKKQVDLSVHYPDGLRRFIPCLPPKDRQNYRKSPPAMSGCRKCGSITCAGVGATGVSCNGQKPKTAPAPAKVTQNENAPVNTKTPPMKHATQAWRTAAIQRCINRGVYCFKQIAENTGIPESEVLPIFIEIKPDPQTKKKETKKARDMI